MPSGMISDIQHDTHDMVRLTALLNQGPHRGLGELFTHGSVGEDQAPHRQETTMVQSIHCSTDKDVTFAAGSTSMQPGSDGRNISAQDALYGARAGYPTQLCGYTPMGTTRPLALYSAFHVAAAIGIGGLQLADAFQFISVSSAISFLSAPTASPL